MNEVKRYDMTIEGGAVYAKERKGSGWVTWCDYDTLQQQLTATTNSLTNAQEALKSAGIEADTVQAGVMEKLNELVGLAKKATPGKWTADWFDDERGYVTWYIDLERQRSAFFLDGDGVQLNGTGNPSDFDKADCNFIAAAHPQVILEIAEAFRALEQRAEAAEAKADNLNNGWLNAISERDDARAKLAELEKQEPVGTVSIAMDWNTHRNVATVNMRPDLVVAEMKNGDELFTRPAPAIDLNAVRAEGVEMFARKCSEKSKQAASSDMRDIWWLGGENASDFAAQLRSGNAGKDGSHE